jgi:hypothetical protein
MQLLSIPKMSKKETALRVGCFLAAWGLFQSVSIILCLVMPSWVPHIITNYLWTLPAWTFPFGFIRSVHGQDYVLTGTNAGLMMAVYLAFLGFLFLKLVQPIRKWLWCVPIAFCFWALSTFALQMLFMVLGIKLYIRSD